MPAIAIILWVSVIITHYGANWLADGSHFSPAAWVYMLMAGSTIVLSLCVLFLMWRIKLSGWAFLCLAALYVYIEEGTQMIVCRTMIADISKVPRGVDLCDFVAGAPIGTPLTVLSLMVLVLIVGFVYWKGERAG